MTFADIFFIFGAKYLFLSASIIVIAFFWKLPREKKGELFIFGAISLPAIYIVSRIAAWLYVDPRPFVAGHFIPLISHEPDNGFPSDHALITAAIAAIVFPFSKKVSTVLWAVAALVGVSRVYVGIHHPIDIVGSAVIAAAVSTVVYFLLQRLRSAKC